MKDEVHFFGQVTQKALIEHNGKFLFVQYPEGNSAAGLWDVPGGRLNEGESPSEGLVREVREEIGVDIELGTMFATGTFTNMSNKRQFLVFHHATIRGDVSAFILEKNEVAVAEWFTPGEALQLPIVYPEYLEILERHFGAEK